MLQLRPGAAKHLKKKKNVPVHLGRRKGKKEADASLPWKIRKGNLWFKINRGRTETLQGDSCREQLGCPVAIAEEACGIGSKTSLNSGDGKPRKRLQLRGWVWEFPSSKEDLYFYPLCAPKLNRN